MAYLECEPMMDYKHITIDLKDGVCTLWLNRPQVRNAFNEEMIQEIIDQLEALADDPDCRVLVFKGKGSAFCAGADLNWMKAALNYSYKENMEESLNLSKCFYLIYTFPKPTIAIVHGAAIGGANGILSACDYVLAYHEAVFSLSEVKIGIVPACISPYVIKRIGEFPARALMLSGKRIDGAHAEKIGLVNFSGEDHKVEAALTELLGQLLTSGPDAMAQCKQLVNSVANHWTLEEAFTHTAELIAKIRQSEEGQEGMSAFLQKRKPNWIP